MLLEDAAYRELMKRMNEHMENGLGTDTIHLTDIQMYITYVRSVPDGTG